MAQDGTRSGGTGGSQGGSRGGSGRSSGGSGRPPGAGSRRPSGASAPRGGGSASSRGGRGGSRVDQGDRTPGAWKADRTDDGRPRRQVPYAPEPDADVTPDQLDRDARAELRTLPLTLAEDVARHLVMTGRLLEDDPDTAYQHASKAQSLASRVAVAREALGLAAYATGRWAQALSELRAARRLSGSDDQLPVMADCERGLGRPERALALAGTPEAARLDQAGRIEMRIVSSGARRDLGQFDAAVLALQVPELKSSAVHPWTGRLRYAYADALLAAGREDEALEWFHKAVDADPEALTDASERLEELEGTVYVDLLGDGDDAADSADAPGRDAERLDLVQPAQDSDEVRPV